MENRERLQRLPSLAGNGRVGSPVEPPCAQCSALCCRYFALQIDTPEDDADFDHVKWYLIHEDTWVWVDDDEWYVQVDRKCKHLRADNQCGIYSERPQICREYGLPEFLEAADDPLCDYFSQDIAHDHEFRTMEELEAFRKRWMARRRKEKKRRAEAARRGWERRRNVRVARRSTSPS